MNDMSNQQYLDLLAQRDALDRQIEEVAAVARHGVIENLKSADGALPDQSRGIGARTCHA